MSYSQVNVRYAVKLVSLQPYICSYENEEAYKAYNVTEVNFYRLLNFYWEIFGTCAYGECCMSLPVCLHHMNECRIIHSIPLILICYFHLYSLQKKLKYSIDISAYKLL